MPSSMGPTPYHIKHCNQTQGRLTSRSGSQAKDIQFYLITVDPPTTRRTRAGPGLDTSSHDATFPATTNLTFTRSDSSRAHKAR